MAPIYKCQCGAWTINQVNPHSALYMYIQFSYPPHKIQKILITKIVYLECLNSASTSVKLKQMLFTFTCAFTSKEHYRDVPR
jgi:hypothetical protein